MYIIQQFMFMCRGQAYCVIPSYIIADATNYTYCYS